MQGKSVFFGRDDTMLGVCQAVADDLGFNPLWLRLAFTLPLFWNPVLVVEAYLALGVVVLASRLLFPSRSKQVAAAAEPRHEPLQARNDAEQKELPLAA